MTSIDVGPSRAWLVLTLAGGGCASGVDLEADDAPGIVTIAASPASRGPASDGCPDGAAACDPTDSGACDSMDTGACDPCPWRADGECDEPQLCAPGTDAEDCSPVAAESSTTSEASSEGGDTTSAVLDGESGETSSSSSGAATDDGAPAAATCDDGTVAGPCADCGRAYCCVWIEQATADAPSSCIAECMLDAGSVPSCGNLCGSADPFAEPGITDLFVCLGAACGGVC